MKVIVKEAKNIAKEVVRIGRRKRGEKNFIIAQGEVNGLINSEKTVGECASRVISIGGELAFNSLLCFATDEIVGEMAAGILLSASMPMGVTIAIATGSALLVGGAFERMTEGVFDETAKKIGNAMDEVKEVVLPNLKNKISDTIDRRRLDTLSDGSMFSVA